MGLPETIDSFLNSDSQRLDTDLAGDLVVFPRTGAGPATVYVRAETSALKRVAASVIVEGVDRESVWQVVGFSLDRSVVASIDESPNLEEAVLKAGFEWTVIEVDWPATPNI